MIIHRNTGTIPYTFGEQKELPYPSGREVVFNELKDTYKEVLMFAMMDKDITLFNKLIEEVKIHSLHYEIKNNQVKVFGIFWYSHSVANGDDFNHIYKLCIKELKITDNKYLVVLAGSEIRFHNSGSRF